ncbi:MAG: BamA/TamA family outer membrane protein [Balneolales bacterium]|nr:BamA/TamA family outer membrane protein [Balneolales bacterium]
MDTTFAQNTYNEQDRIWNVEIEGNSSYEDIVIKQYIANENPNFWGRLLNLKKAGASISEEEILKDVIRIERFYYRRGFPEADVNYRIQSKPREWQKELIFEVSENRPLLINSVEILLQTDEVSESIILQSQSYQRELNRIPFRNGRRYQQIQQIEVVGSLTKVIRNLGFPYVYTEVEADIDEARSLADVRLIIDTGPRARLNNVLIEGNETISSSYILRETGLQQGEFYNEEDIADAQREVYKHHLFRLALISTPEQVQDSTVDIALQVKELPLRSFRIRGGVGDFDRDPLWWQLLRFQSSWVYRNVGSRGQQFSITGKLSYFDKSMDLEYLFPYVYNTKSSFIVNPYLENKIEESYSITSGGIINSFGYEYSRNLTGTFSYEFALNNEYDLRIENPDSLLEVLPDSILAYNISSFSFNAYYALGLQSGKRGWIIQPYWELSGLFGESSFSFQKISLDVRKYTQVNPSLVVATRVQGGAIYYAKQDSLPSDILYYAGGTSSIRGYSRQDVGPKRPELKTNELGSIEDVEFIPLGGNSVFNFNIEFRQQLDRMLKGFGVAAFLDGGQVWRDLPNLSSRPVQYGAGGGLRYDSPIGPIRIDVAYKVNPNDDDLQIYQGVDYGGSRWRVHFSIGQAF